MHQRKKTGLWCVISNIRLMLVYIVLLML